MLRRLVLTAIALSFLGVIFLIGKSSYQEQGVSEKSAAIDLPASHSVLPDSIPSIEGELSEWESNLFDKSELTDSGVFPEVSELAFVENCEENPLFGEGRIYEFTKNVGLLPTGLFPNSGRLEGFSIYLKRSDDFVLIDVRSDPTHESNYKIFAFAFKTIDQLKGGDENLERLELSPESMVSQSKADLFESIQNELNRFRSQGAELGVRFVSLSAEIPVQGQTRIVRVELKNSRIIGFSVSPIVNCQRIRSKLTCQCFQSKANLEDVELEN
jgi:hypothetical protein